MTPNNVKVIAFDLFGTVFDMSGVPREEFKAYGRHIKQPEWSPLVLPDSWAKIPAFPDSKEGIDRLIAGGYQVIPLSNCPMRLCFRMSDNAGIEWSTYYGLEHWKIYKPDPEAYGLFCAYFDFEPSEVLMVTANEKFGDIEAARALGMQAVLIRGTEYPTINDLADALLDGGLTKEGE